MRNKQYAKQFSLTDLLSLLLLLLLPPLIALAVVIANSGNTLQV
jgi:hypothetical protein